MKIFLWTSLFYEPRTWDYFCCECHLHHIEQKIKVAMLNFCSTSIMVSSFTHQTLQQIISGSHSAKFTTPASLRF